MLSLVRQSDLAWFSGALIAWLAISVVVLVFSDVSFIDSVFSSVLVLGFFSVICWPIGRTLLRFEGDNRHVLDNFCYLLFGFCVVVVLMLAVRILQLHYLIFVSSSLLLSAASWTFLLSRSEEIKEKLPTSAFYILLLFGLPLIVASLWSSLGEYVRYIFSVDNSFQQTFAHGLKDNFEYPPRLLFSAGWLISYHFGSAQAGALLAQLAGIGLHQAFGLFVVPAGILASLGICLVIVRRWIQGRWATAFAIFLFVGGGLMVYRDTQIFLGALRFGTLTPTIVLDNLLQDSLTHYTKLFGFFLGMLYIDRMLSRGGSLLFSISLIFVVLMVIIFKSAYIPAVAISFFFIAVMRFFLYKDKEFLISGFLSACVLVLYIWKTDSNLNYSLIPYLGFPVDLFMNHFINQYSVLEPGKAFLIDWGHAATYATSPAFWMRIVLLLASWLDNLALVLICLWILGRRVWEIDGYPVLVCLAVIFAALLYSNSTILVETSYYLEKQRYIKDNGQSMRLIPYCIAIIGIYLYSKFEGDSGAKRRLLPRIVVLCIVVVYGVRSISEAGFYGVRPMLGHYLSADLMQDGRQIPHYLTGEVGELTEAIKAIPTTKTVIATNNKKIEVLPSLFGHQAFSVTRGYAMEISPEQALGTRFQDTLLKAGPWRDYAGKARAYGWTHLLIDKTLPAPTDIEGEIVGQTSRFVAYRIRY